MRKDFLVEGQVYHIYNKSIAEYKIFNSKEEFMRMLNVFSYYLYKNLPTSFSQYIKLSNNKKDYFLADFIRLDTVHKNEKYVEIIAYCIMPTHIHFILKQLKDNGISIFMKNVENSYTRYFNIRHNRKGPLWVGRFENKLVKTAEDLLQMTRYLHLNPVSAYLVDNPEDWNFSSYNEYIASQGQKICSFKEILEIEPQVYKEFVKDRISFQRELAKIKKLAIE